MSLSRMKKLHFSKLTPKLTAFSLIPLLLAGCNADPFSWMRDDHPAQVVEGPKHRPPLNPKDMTAPGKPGEVPMVQMSGARDGKVPNAYDMYNEDGTLRSGPYAGMQAAPPP